MALEVDEPSSEESPRARGTQKTFADRAYEALHDAIVTGRLKPGERLIIDQLAERLDMSPMPVREALRRLHQVGLVESLPHRSARVAPISLENLEEVYAARMALEPVTIERAARHFTRADEQHARQAHDELEAAHERRDALGTWTWHSEFHMTLYRAAKAQVLIRAITPLWQESERYRFTVMVERPFLDVRREHLAILEACVEHNPQLASVLLHNHLAATANVISRAMDGPHELFGTRRVPGDRRRRPAAR